MPMPSRFETIAILLGLVVGLLAVVLQVPSSLIDSLQLCDRFKLCSAAPTPRPEPQQSGGVPSMTDELLADPPEACANAPTVSVKTIDLRDGEELPAIARAIALRLTTPRFSLVPWPFSHADDPMLRGDRAALQIAALPAVLVLAKLSARDRSIFVADGREFFEIDGTLELFVLSGPCGQRALAPHTLHAKGVGEHYADAMGSLAEEFGKAFKKNVIAAGL